MVSDPAAMDRDQVNREPIIEYRRDTRGDEGLRRHFQEECPNVTVRTAGVIHQKALERTNR